MDRFLEMRAFVQVVEAGSFIGAAEPLEMSKAAVSRYVGELESRLRVRLLNRTTRRLSLTEEGELFYARCKELLGHLEAAEAELTSRTEEAIGLLRVSVPVSFGILHLANAWGQFKARHPKVTFDLARHGTPTEPSELTAHNIIAYSNWSLQDEWPFEGPQGRVSVRTSPCIRTNSGDTCRASALAHEGIILQPTFLVGRDLEAGTLVELFPTYRPGTLGIHAVYHSRKHVAPKVRLLIDFLVERFARPPWPE